MSDERITKYREAAIALSKGSFDINVPLGPDDEIARLGEAICVLATNLQQRFGQFTRLAEITERINAGLVIDDVLSFVFDTFRPIIPYDRIGLALIDAEAKTVRARWARSVAEHIRLKKNYSESLPNSSLEKIIESGKPRIINDLRAYLEGKPESESTRLVVEEGMQSSLTCPLVALGKPVGFLFFSSMKPNTYDRVHEELFLQIAGQLSVIVEKSRLYQELIDLNQELHVARRELQIQATHDKLTGLWNRAAIMDILNKEMVRWQRHGGYFAVAMADIDFFKSINDTHGHLVGDVVLARVANIISQATRLFEEVGRFGGEEFVIILTGCDKETTESIIDRIRRQVKKSKIETRAGSFQITISVGAAVSKNYEQVDSETLLRIADEALYAAKTAGRDRTRVQEVERVDL